jgi:hypothetical protein
MKKAKVKTVEILDTLFDTYRWYRKLRKGKWYHVHYYLDPGLRYWMKRKPLPNEVIIREEKY